MAKGKFKKVLNRLGKRLSHIPGPIGDIAKGVDDIIDDAQFEEGTGEESAAKNQKKDGEDAPPPPKKKWYQQVPVWGWIVGGVVVLFGVYKMMTNKHHKGGRNVRY